jgi:hypothetical protein
VDDDRLLFDWLRHYGRGLILFLLLGLGGGLAYAALGPREYEAWTIVTQSGEGISTRQLDTLSHAVFRSEAVYVPALRELGVGRAPLPFYREHTELRPVPDTGALIVVGKDDDRERAAEISSVMARHLVTAFTVRALTPLEVFGRVAPRAHGIAGRVATVLGATVGFWAGLGASALHYRARRPLLSLRRAIPVAGADRVDVPRRRGPRWLGAGRRARVVRRTAEPGVLVAHAGTPERALARAAAERDGGDGVRLVWVR